MAAADREDEGRVQDDPPAPGATDGGWGGPTPAPVQEPVRPRGPRPLGPPRPSISDYTPAELQSIVAWIQSDGVLRTDGEILDLAVDELGFSRRGARITQAILDAIRAWRAGHTP